MKVENEIIKSKENKNKNIDKVEQFLLDKLMEVYEIYCDGNYEQELKDRMFIILNWLYEHRQEKQ